MAISRRKVTYMYQDNMNYYYGMHHPMKPFRLMLTHDLILSYGLYRKLRVLRPHPASAEEMIKFHAPDYIQFLQRVNPENVKKQARYDSEMVKFGIGEQTDCPVFENMFEFFQAYTGASLDAAYTLNRGEADICINWSGGLHHAKKRESSGFCYVNDIVLAILELLKVHARVLYIDIDIHHGDGVEEAFYNLDRVMTVSFHKYGEFFPGTGDIADVGVEDGMYTSVNFPLKNGMDDRNYAKVFKPVIQEVMEVFRPGAIVLQCGADSLSGDRLCAITGGCFNLTLDGHAECVKFVKSFGVPLLVLGGGGYTVRNVARCWVNETALLLDEEISDDIPRTCKFLRYFVPDLKLTLPVGNAVNLNDEKELERNKRRIFENLRQLKGAPSVQMKTVPSPWAIERAKRQAETDPDVRESQEEADLRVESPLEFFGSEKDNAGEAGRAEEAAAKAAKNRAPVQEMTPPPTSSSSSSSTTTSSSSSVSASPLAAISTVQARPTTTTTTTTASMPPTQTAAAAGGAGSGAGSGAGFASGAAAAFVGGSKDNGAGTSTSLPTPTANPAKRKIASSSSSSSSSLSVDPRGAPHLPKASSTEDPDADGERPKIPRIVRDGDGEGAEQIGDGEARATASGPGD